MSISRYSKCLREAGNLDFHLNSPTFFNDSNMYIFLQYLKDQDFPGGSVVKNPPSNEGDTGSSPGWGTKIPRATGQLSPCTLEPGRHS